MIIIFEGMDLAGKGTQVALLKKKLEEEKKATEIYKTYEGKDYTFNEWKKYEQKAYDEYRKQKERKSKGFWG